MAGLPAFTGGLVEGWTASNDRVRRLDEGVERHGWRMLLLTRLVPVFPFNLQNYAYGLTRIGFLTYLVVTAVFMIPGTAALVIAGDASDREGWAGTILALSNGTIGVRGVIEERAHASTFLAEAYEQSPIHYHERLHGFADTSDTRVPVVEPLGLRVLLDGAAVDFAAARLVDTSRALDLRSGLLRRHSRWALVDGRELTIHAERLVQQEGIRRHHVVGRLRAEQQEVDRVAIDFVAGEQVLGRGYADFPQHFPAPGLVEHDPEFASERICCFTSDQLKRG